MNDLKKHVEYLLRFENIIYIFIYPVSPVRAHDSVGSKTGSPCIRGNNS